jgi:hypothetical protein
MQPYAVMNVTDADKSVILQVHNSLRQNVANGLETRGNPGPQPPAANMRELVREIKFSLTGPVELSKIYAFCRPGMTNWPPWLKLGLSSATLQLTMLTGTSVMCSVLVIQSNEFNV